MRTVEINKEELLKIVTKNRQDHRKVFLEAQEGFKEEVINQLELSLEEARIGKRFRTNIQLHAPIDQTKDYDRVIKMLQMEVNDTVELDESEFSMYVQDDWHWKAGWTVSNSMYMKTSH